MKEIRVLAKSVEEASSEAANVRPSPSAAVELILSACCDSSCNS